jgi:choline dehydrogenase
MDIRVHLGGMRLIRRMLNTPELSPFLEAETLPGPEAQSDDELLDFAKKNGSTTYHLIGTARMGPATDPTAVVSDRLLVHGMEALRIVDASIMPSMPSANTYATTMMIAEKAADFIRGREAPAEAA